MGSQSRWIAPYERSRDARRHESRVADVYDLVYDADRPELFLKDACGRRTVGMITDTTGFADTMTLPHRSPSQHTASVVRSSARAPA